MSNIISLPQAFAYHFAVYTHKIVRGTELSEYRAIVLRDADGHIEIFTGLEAFSYEYTGQTPKIQVRRKQELSYICRALNDIFSNNRISCIADITDDMIFGFFDDYCSPKLTARSMHNCILHTSYFFANLAREFDMKFKPADLLNTEYVKRNKRSQKLYKKYVPKYDVPKKCSSGTNIPRDLPFHVVQKLIDLAYIYDKMIAFAIVAQVSSGLRGSCVMNMRQADSPVSLTPGISISYAGDGVNRILIDLENEYVLRADGVSVGRIKKKRTVEVYPKFRGEFYTAYTKHLEHLKKCNVDPHYKPLFVSRNGQAMTYSTYQYRLHKLIKNHLIPWLEKSKNPEDIILAQKLRLRNISSHVFRHVFSVRLVLEGLDVAQIMTYRGDRSPESALVYLANKGELLKILEDTHTSAIAGLARGGVSMYESDDAESSANPK